MKIAGMIALGVIAGVLVGETIVAVVEERQEARLRRIVADEMCKTLVASKLAKSCTPSAQ